MAVRVEQILRQRSYMPVFPAPVSFPLDLSRLQGTEMSTTPHVLIAPSDLKYLAQVRKTLHKTLRALQVH